MRALRLVCALLGSACATDFGPVRDYLPCNTDGACADGYACATLDIGRVCLTIAAFEDRCGSLEQCNGRDDDCDGETDEDFRSLGDACDVGIGACRAYGVDVCAGDGTVTCSAMSGVPSDEICNGRDDDCDGETDEDIPDVVTGLDVGECQSEITRCSGGQMVVLQPAIAPKSEACNFLDDDCDGSYDEDFSPALDEACAVGIGACRAFGVAICAPDGAGTVCSAAEVTPTLDVCDGIDNDCDGTADQIFLASFDLGEPCANGVGPCARPGTMACTPDGFGTACDAIPGESGVEVCDGEDNDCDGTVDDELVSCCKPGDSQYCSTDVGECDFGTQTCGADRAWGPCTGFLPTDEVCDGLDNDCNGAVDDGVTNCCAPGNVISCSTDEGACTAGEQTCGADRAWGPCLDASGALAVLPTVDLCDHADNDCDGFTDEDFFGVRVDGCSVGQGPCRRDGIMDCRADGYGLACNAVPGVSEVERCDGEDNDCDGEPDNDLGLDCCEPHAIRGCSLDIGECRSGTQECGADRAWVPCSGQELVEEECDGRDNDCDGRTDEEILDCCDPGMLLSCSTDEGVCTAGVQECGADRAWGPCLDAGGMPAVLPEADQCDGLDNDCDGATDESFVGLLDFCDVGIGACAARGLWVCTDDGDGAHCSATPGTPTFERCDGTTDEDCDGWTDEPWDAVLGTACTVGVGACARDGFWVCAEDGSGIVCDAEAGDPTEEICDGLDNDCNGSVDNDVAVELCYDGPFETLDVGPCRAGATACVDGHTYCDGDILPAAEFCDAVDNDCDGVTDGSYAADGITVLPLTQPCYSGDPRTIGLGACTAGSAMCTDGRWGDCVGEVAPRSLPENCGSCAGLQELGRGSGVQQIVIGTEVADVFCDMETDGGGWTLVLAYDRQEDDNASLVIGVPPLDPATGYSHLSTLQLQGFPWEELQCFCTSGAHARTLHFKTAHAGAVAYVRGEGGNDASFWYSQFFSFPDHTASLPANANFGGQDAGDLRLTLYPFYRGGSAHWALRVNDFEWACDDAVPGTSFATHHAVWVR